MDSTVVSTVNHKQINDEAKNKLDFDKNFLYYKGRNAIIKELVAI